MASTSDDRIEYAAQMLRDAKNVMVFTGAGISVESGIPPFRGSGGLWETHDPEFIEINHFLGYPRSCWKQIREIFYDHWGQAEPNAAHYAVTSLQKGGKAQTIVTQNIDCMHQRAGSISIAELHGTLEFLICLSCNARFKAEPSLTDMDLPKCPTCGGLLKPDIVFFGESLPEKDMTMAYDAVEVADAVIVIGSSGEVMPACMIPRDAKRRGAKIIEVNFDPSRFTESGVSDILLQGKAGEIMPKLVEKVLK